MPIFSLNEYNTNDTQDRIQVQSSTDTLYVRSGSNWVSHQFRSGNESRDKYLFGTTTPLLAESAVLQYCTNNATALTTGTMTSIAIYLTKGTIVSAIGYIAGTTALANPTHQTCGLYDTSATPAVVAACSSGDLTNTVTWSAYTMYKHAMATPYTIPTSGVYYVALTITGTVPTLMSTVAQPNLGLLTGASLQTGAYDQVVRSGSALAGVLPATITSTTVLTFTPWVGIF